MGSAGLAMGSAVFALGSGPAGLEPKNDLGLRIDAMPNTLVLEEKGRRDIRSDGCAARQGSVAKARAAIHGRSVPYGWRSLAKPFPRRSVLQPTRAEVFSERLEQ